MDLSINPFAASPGVGVPIVDAPTSMPLEPSPITCPHCAAEIPADSEWQSCPYCQKSMQIRVWQVVRPNSSVPVALSEEATCFFHPEKAFQACCQRCGRFVCALCDLQLGSEHVCPTCFERGRSDSGAEAGKAEWRYRDVLYDSIAVTVGWGWILFWPSFLVALPAVIVLHVKFHKSPRSYLIPRSGWRFWMAYVGFVWPVLLIGAPLFVRWMAARH